MQPIIAILKNAVYEKIIEAYSIMGRTDTICLDGIPFPSSLPFSNDELGSCMINAYDLLLGCTYYPELQKWDIDYEIDEVSDHSPHIVNHG